MEKLTVEALRSPNYRNTDYKRIKRFRKEKQAKAYLDHLSKKYKSRRLPPIIEQVKIGMGLGYWYYVCIPKVMVIK